MKKIQLSDVKDILEYEKIRDSFQRSIIDLKKRRRVSVGPLLSFIFENRETALFQIQEMVRVERIVQEEKIAEEVEVYNALVPDQDELSATMFIEITDQERVKPDLDRLMGIDEGQRVWLQFGDQRVYGQFEAGHSKEDKISAVHYVRFPFTPQQSRRFCSGQDPLSLVADHPNYQEEAAVPPDVRESLVKDLEE